MNNSIPIHQFRSEEIISSQRLIEAIDQPLTPVALDHIHEAIEVEGRQVSQAFRAKKHEELAQAEAAETESSTKVEENRERLNKAEAELQQTKRGSFYLAAIFILCTVVSFAAEFTLTFVSLPYILEINRWSFLGIMVSLAPPTALVVLKIVIARLLEEPWQEIQSPDQPRVKRAIVVSLMASFLIALAWLNLLTVMKLQAAREEAMIAKAAIEKAEIANVVVNRQVINQAVLYVSLAVTLGGAVFFLFGFFEFQRAARRAGVKTRVDQSREQQEHLEEELSKAQAQVRIALRAYDVSETDAEIVAASFRQHRLCQLDIKMASLRFNQSILKTVDDIFAGGWRKQPVTYSSNGSRFNAAAVKESF